MQRAAIILAAAAVGAFVGLGMWWPADNKAPATRAETDLLSAPRISEAMLKAIGERVERGCVERFYAELDRRAKAEGVTSDADRERIRDELLKTEFACTLKEPAQ